MSLPFGYNAGLPENVTAAWGCRLIVTQDGTTDFLFDRQGGFGEESHGLYAWLDSGAVDAAREAASTLLRSYKMSTRSAEHFVLYEDEHGVIVGNTNGSGGYLYLAAWLFDAVPN